MGLIDAWNALWGTEAKKHDTSTAIVVKSGSENVVRDFSNAIKTDRKIARQLYHNTNKNYLLAAQLTKPIINNNVNFIGKPTLYGNKKALKVLEEVKINYRAAHKALEIEGDVFVWPQWNVKKGKIELVYIPVDVVKETFIDPISKEVMGYRLEETVFYTTPEKVDNEVKITHVITAAYVIRSTVGAINEVKRFANPLGFLPIVHFHNDRDLQEAFGHSELENVEPQLKFYHELTYEAGAAQSRDGHPKMKVSTTNPKQWVENNYGKGSFDALLAGQITLSMEDKDLFINNEGDDVNYLYLNKTTGDYLPLAGTTFTNIVEGSETPEINFGANIGTSLASVKEFRPVWIKKIEAKQEEREEPWLEVYDIIIKLHNFVKLTNVKNDITVEWPRPNFASIKEQSEIVQAFATAIDKLKARNLITNEEVYKTLVKLDIFEMFKSYKEHEEVVNNEQDETSNTEPDAAAEEDSDTGAEEETEDDESNSE